MKQSPAIDYDKVADLYDEYVRVSFDVPYFLNAARQATGDVLELMSGTGRVSLPLIEAGVQLTCVDRSAEMLAVLRRKLEQRGFRFVSLHGDYAGSDLCESSPFMIWTLERS